MISDEGVSRIVSFGSYKAGNLFSIGSRVGISFPNYYGPSGTVEVFVEDSWDPKVKLF